MEDKAVYRYERKFITTTMDLKEVEHALLLNPLGFKEIYKKRRINSIYLDSMGMNGYHTHDAGISKRHKVRIRWYGTCFGKNKQAVLEIKIKKGFLGRKRKFALPPFDIGRDFDWNTLRTNIITHANLPKEVIAELEMLRPTCLVSYIRKYFLSKDKRFRVTLDDDLHYFKMGERIQQFREFTADKEGVVIEIKYDQEHDQKISLVTTSLPLRLIANSKYLNGIEGLFL